MRNQLCHVLQLLGQFLSIDGPGICWNMCLQKGQRLSATKYPGQSTSLGTRVVLERPTGPKHNGKPPVGVELG